MSALNSYYRGTMVAWLFRFWVYTWVVAILALTLGACSVPKPTDILTRMSASTDVSQREGTQTRNDEPQSGGCHEKSDGSLRKPLT